MVGITEQPLSKAINHTQNINTQGVEIACSELLIHPRKKLSLYINHWKHRITTLSPWNWKYIFKERLLSIAMYSTVHWETCDLGAGRRSAPCSRTSRETTNIKGSTTNSLAGPSCSVFFCWLHLYSAFLTCGHSKLHTISTNIHPFMHTYTPLQRCKPRKATASSPGVSQGEVPCSGTLWQLLLR